MGNRKSLEITVTECVINGGKVAHRVNVPHSLTGGRGRIRKFFVTRGDAEEFRAKFQNSLIRGGSDLAMLDEALTVNRALAEFISAKMPDASLPQARALRVNAGRIAHAFGTMQLEQLGGAVHEVDLWLKKNFANKRTRFNAYSYLRTFVRWCHRRGKMKVNRLDLLSEEIKKPPAPKVMISAMEMRMLLKLTKEDKVLRAAMVFGGFAGLRTEEILKLEWSNLDWAAKEIHVPPGVIKDTSARGGMRERYVDMLPVFIARMPRGLSGRVIPLGPKAFYERRQKLLPLMRREFASSPELVAKWKHWPTNCLRHSFASCLLAAQKDAWKVAHQLGHSNTKTIHQDYARAVREAEAREYLEMGEATKKSLVAPPAKLI